MIKMRDVTNALFLLRKTRLLLLFHGCLLAWLVSPLALVSEMWLKLRGEKPPFAALRLFTLSAMRLLMMASASGPPSGSLVSSTLSRSGTSTTFSLMHKTCRSLPCLLIR